MKRKILFFLALSVFTTKAQNKITSIVDKYYSEGEILGYIDSAFYNYQWNMGIINSHSPQFTIDGNAPVYLYQHVAPTLNYLTQTQFGNADYPLNQYNASTKSYDGNGNCTMDLGTGWRETWTYTASGKIATYTYEMETSPGIWEIQDKDDYFYDASDRRIAHHYYDGNLGYYTSKDSTWYSGTTNNITMYAYYESNDGVVFDQFARSETTWAGNVATIVKYYEDDDSDPQTPPVWMLNGVYTYSIPNYTKFEVYLVVGGVPSSSVIAQWDYTFNGSNQLISDVQTGNFGDARIDYTYQADGLLETIDRQEDPGTGMYTYNWTKFYYTDVAGIEENKLDFVVYPNPTTDKVNFSQSFEMVRVYNMKGELLIQQANTESIDLSSLPTGNYMVHVVDGSAFGSQNIVKN